MLFNLLFLNFLSLNVIFLIFALFPRSTLYLILTILLSKFSIYVSTLEKYPLLFNIDLIKFSSSFKIYSLKEVGSKLKNVVVLQIF